MSSYRGSFGIDDTLTFYVQAHNPATAGIIAADAVPTYRIYEDETATPILTGSMATLDSGNATGFYSKQITLSAVNGFELGKSYAIRIAVVVNGVTGVEIQTFQIGAGVDVRAISQDVTAADNLETMLDGTGGQVLSLKQLNIVNNSGTALVAQSTGSNGKGIHAIGHGTGAGVYAKGGATAPGVEAWGGDTSGPGIQGASKVGATQGAGIAAYSFSDDGDGLECKGDPGSGILAQSVSGDLAGLRAIGSSSNPGIGALGGPTGAGITAVGQGDMEGFGAYGEGDGAGIRAAGQGTGSGEGIYASGASDGHGIRAGGQGAGAGIAAFGGATGKDMDADEIHDTVPLRTGTVLADGSNTAATFKTDLTNAQTDAYKYAFVTFKSGTLIDQTRKITGYNGTTKFLTTDAFSTAPSASDAFVIVNR